MAGMSLSDYLLGELREIAERPTLAEFRDRLHKRKPLPVLGTYCAMIVLDASATVAGSRVPNEPSKTLVASPRKA